MEPKAKRHALLYVSDSVAGTVSAYSYPELNLKAKLIGFRDPEGLCVDTRTGNIWVTETSPNRIVEFAHRAAAPIRTLKTGAESVRGCAVDPSNGNLAVASTSAYEDPGVLLVYKNGRGTPTTYSDRRIFSFYFVAYDGNGNVFVDGLRGKHFRLAELPKGGKKLVDIAWGGPKIRVPGGVQYDGASLAVGNARQPVIYQTSNGVVTGTTTLKGACDVNQFFIDGGRLIAPSACGSKGDVLIYDYPAGGAPIKKLAGFTFPFGVVISR